AYEIETYWSSDVCSSDLASRVCVYIVGRREGQRQEFLHLRRQILIGRGEVRRRPRIARHQVDHINEIGLAEELQGPRKGLRAERSEERRVGKEWSARAAR